MSLTSLKKVTWERLNKLGEKGQKYILHKEAAALLTEMQTSYYRLKRRFLEQECQVDTHFALGMSNGRWAELAAQTPEGLNRAEIERLTALAETYDYGPTGELWADAQRNFAEVSLWVASGGYKTAITDAELQAKIATVHTGIPRIRYQCPHGGA